MDIFFLLQDVALAVYKASNEVILDDPANGYLFGPHNPDPNVNGPELGDFVGWLTARLENGEADQIGDTYSDDTPYAAKGYNGPLKDEHGAYATPPFEFTSPDEPGYTNTLNWDGYTTNKGVTTRLGEGTAGGQAYVIVIQW